VTDLLAITVSSFFLAFSGAAMPGPLMTATIGESARRGPVAGPALVAGHGILELLLVILLMLGLAPFLKQDMVFAVIAMAGALMLAGMGVSMLLKVPGLTLSREASGGGMSRLVAAGAVLSLSNPYWTLWWSTIGLTYILYSARLGNAGVALFFAGHLLGDLAWYSALSFAVGRGRRFMSDRSYRVIVALCSLFLVVLAAVFAVSGLRTFLSV